ncbi:histidine kinase dimerization/phosphoacceptor domain -containing protein [Hymenobacter weizhouensis]|uniref:histidine kinase dimerization/phosphoacceptor domain -containing protein n=1 Tax=Hymenobacter sp. YIM 151500-1 TaxID=2987689 RepID=UPI002227698C|nr:histidine kinase dimerization/phosphoacceptor domain -containing protein [Hymenobacter sp. YIM 151500-1]UYZ63881.1 ATP-binding protein [Hymenobacter sp. YIM 151500-1]
MQSLAIGRQLRNDTLEAQGLTALGLLLHAHYHSQCALPLFYKAAAIYRGVARPDGEANMYNAVGVAQCKLNRYAASIQAHQVAVRLYKQALKQKGSNTPALKLLLSRTYNYLGIAYDNSDNSTQSIQAYLQSLHLAEEVADQEQIATALANVGYLYQRQLDYARARHYLQKALRHFQEMRDTVDMAALHINLGNLHVERQQDSAALRHLKIGMALEKKLGARAQPDLVATGFYDLGEIAARRGDYAAALANFRQALVLFERLEMLSQQTSTLSSMATSYRKAGQHGLALVYGRRALATAQKLGLPSSLAESYGVLADINVALGHYDAAYTYRQQQQAEKDSIFNQKRAQQIAVLQLQYEDKRKELENKRKESEITLLRRNMVLQGQLRNGLVGGLFVVSLLGLVALHRYALQRRANRQLQARDAEIAEQNVVLAEQNNKLTSVEQQLRRSLGEKEVLLREVHHRVKNNLQIIHSLLSLQGRRQPLPAVGVVLREGQNWIKSIALTHEMLYRAADLASVEFQPFLIQLTQSLQHTLAPVLAAAVRCQVQAEGMRLNASTAVPLALIVNELVANAYEHAFPENRAGTVRVELRTASPGCFVLVVADDGVGLPSELDWKRASSLGLRLIHSLARQLQGELQVHSTPAGTTFTLTFSEIVEVSLPA